MLFIAAPESTTVRAAKQDVADGVAGGTSGPQPAETPVSTGSELMDWMLQYGGVTCRTDTDDLSGVTTNPRTSAPSQYDPATRGVVDPELLAVPLPGAQSSAQVAAPATEPPVPNPTAQKSFMERLAELARDYAEIDRNGGDPERLKELAAKGGTAALLAGIAQLMSARKAAGQEPADKAAQKNEVTVQAKTESKDEKRDPARTERTEAQDPASSEHTRGPLGRFFHKVGSFISGGTGALGGVLAGSALATAVGAAPAIGIAVGVVIGCRGGIDLFKTLFNGKSFAEKLYDPEHPVASLLKSSLTVAGLFTPAGIAGMMVGHGVGTIIENFVKRSSRSTVKAPAARTAVPAPAPADE